MSVLNEHERTRCLEQGEPFGNALLCFETDEILAFRPPPSGGQLRLLQTISVVFFLLALGTIAAYFLAPPDPKNLWVAFVGPPVFMGLAFVLRRAVGAWTEVRFRVDGFDVCVHKGLSKNDTALEGPWTAFKGISMKFAGKGSYSVILEVQKDVVIAVGRKPGLDPTCQRLLDWIEQRRRG